MKKHRTYWTTVVAMFCCGLASTAFGQFQFQRLKSFGIPDLAGHSPTSGLLEASDGKLYGTTSNGGSNDVGTIFSVNKDGGGYAALHSFSREDGFSGYDGWPSRGDLVEGSDGALYGTTGGGGSNNAGTVFKLGKDGSSYTILHHFGSSGGDGAEPESGVIEASDGKFYGTTVRGGSDGSGTVFRLNRDGGGYTVLHSNVAGYPRAALVEGSDGALYGTSYCCAGAIFKIKKDGSGYTILHRFGDFAGDGAYPTAGLVEGTDGTLYGTTSEGGTDSYGTVFRLNKDGNGYALLHSFSQNKSPQAALIEGNEGALYGTTRPLYLVGLEMVFRLNKDGSAFTILHDFSGGPGDGWLPAGGLVEANDGKLYGTTQGGGFNEVGTVFKLNKDGGDFGLVHQFVPDLGGGDAVRPDTKLVEASNGAIYGTTRSGGSNDLGTVFTLNKDGSGSQIVRHFGSNPGDGYFPTCVVEGNDGFVYGTTAYGGTNYMGTVFKMNRDGSSFSIVHHFGITAADGRSPQTLVEGNDGALYGTTSTGGTYTNQFGWGLGTVFRLTKDGSSYSVLHEFGSVSGDGSGWEPYASVVEGSDGALFGTTSVGGSTNANYQNGGGTVFKLMKDGTGYMILHRFTGAPGDGVRPRAALVEGSDGAMYGATDQGGIANAGTVFRINKDGSGYSILHHFSEQTDGGFPYGDLVEGSGGALYGTTVNGGPKGHGTVFTLNKNGNGFTVLHPFSGRDGSQPTAGLLKGSDGAFYGTTGSGGDAGVGTVFKLYWLVAITRLERNTSGALLNLSGVPNRPYRIQARTNLTEFADSWVDIATNAAALDGQFQFFSVEPPNRPARFYRIAWP